MEHRSLPKPTLKNLVNLFKEAWLLFLVHCLCTLPRGHNTHPGLIAADHLQRLPEIPAQKLQKIQRVCLRGNAYGDSAEYWLLGTVCMV